MAVGRCRDREPPIYLFVSIFFFSLIRCFSSCTRTSNALLILLFRQNALSLLRTCFYNFAHTETTSELLRPHARIRTQAFMHFSCPLAQSYPALGLTVTINGCLLHRGHRNTGIKRNVDKRCDNLLLYPKNLLLPLLAPELCAASAKPKRKISFSIFDSLSTVIDFRSYIHCQFKVWDRQIG